MWRLVDGEAISDNEKTGGKSASETISRSGDPKGSDGSHGLVIGEGCFEGGVGAMDWSLDGRQLCTVSRDQKK